MNIDKKKFIQIGIVIGTLIVIFSFVFVSVGKKSKEDKTYASHAYGPFISIESVEGSFDEGFEILNLINNIGMSGSEGRNHTHSNIEDDMWRVTTSEQEENISIIFDLGSVVPLGEMLIWNYNGVDEGSEKLETDKGLKNVQIFHSTDNENWAEWEGDGYPFRLAQADGTDELYATNLDGERHSEINFNGEPVQYVKVIANNKPGDGNWSEDSHVFGLSGVRFFRHATPVVVNGEIIPIGVKTDGINEQMGIENMINKFGMKDSEHHLNDETAMWIGHAQKDESVSLTFDLGGTYPLKEMNVWNYNQKGSEDRGLKSIQVFHSMDGEDWTELKGERYPYQLAKGTGDTELSATNLNNEDHSPITFDGIQAQFIKIASEIEDGNWGAENGTEMLYGLSEVQFIAAPGIAVEPAYEWDELFSRYDGWTGADGTYSLSLDIDQEKETNLFLFSDTYIGNVHPVSKQRRQAGMLNNTLAMLEGTEPDPTKINFIWTANISDMNLFTPKTPNSSNGSWYWLQDGVQIDDELHLFPILMVDDPGGEDNFKFAIGGVTMISVPLSEEGPIIEEQEQIDTPLFKELASEDGNFVFGGTILDLSQDTDDGYIYVYGYKDFVSGEKDLVVARTKPENIDDFDEYQYWDGETWSSDMLAASTLINGVSPELSVNYLDSGPYKGKYVATFSKDTLSGYVAISYADSPHGPFSETESLYFVPEAHQDDVITYNAKAHPQLSAPDELLISYNVNAVTLNKNMSDSDIYRPRWVKVREIKDVEK